MAQAQPSPHSVIRAHVQTLSLSHFRNYHTERLEPGPGAVVLTGPNGAGKTNVLEAISLLVPGRGLRRAALSDIDNMQDQAPWAVAAEVNGPQGVVQIGTGRDPEAGEDDKRITKIEGKVARAQSDLAKVFMALWLTPQMDNLFIEGDSARRKFLDRLVYSFDTEHASHVNAYEYVMRERNRLLQMGQSDASWFDSLERKMAEHGVAIAAQRQHAVEALNSAMQHLQHSFPRAYLNVSGSVESLLAEGSALQAEEKFVELLAGSRVEDARAGRSLTGVHRSHVGVMHVEKNMPAERCSTGEQKALLVSIILAQTRAGAAWHGRVPVLLLDEVVTHLDEMRRSELFSELSEVGAQCWLTGTDRQLFDGLNARFLAVEAGKIKA